MLRIDMKTDIDRPPTTVFALLAAPEREVEWQEGLTEARFTSEGPPGVGSTGEDIRRFLGRRIVTTWQVTEYVPPARIGFRVVSGPMPFEGVFQLDALDQRTRLTYAVQVATKGFARIFGPLTARVVRGQMSRQLAGLKRVLESES